MSYRIKLYSCIILLILTSISKAELPGKKEFYDLCAQEDKKAAYDQLNELLSSESVQSINSWLLGYRWLDNPFNWSPLHTAARLGHNQIVELILARFKFNPEEFSMSLTPFHMAAAYGHNEAVQTFINHGVSIDLASEDGYPPIHYAFIHNHISTVELLLANGATAHKEYYIHVTSKKIRETYILLDSYIEYKNQGLRYLINEG